MKRLKLFSLVGVVFFVNSLVIAGVYDHFDDGVLDPAWQVNYNNASSWTYAENGTKLTASGITTVNSSNQSTVTLKRSLYAPGDFEIKGGISWDNLGTDSVRSGIEIWACSGNTLVAQGGYSDWWITHTGQKVARINSTQYMYDSGQGTLPFAGSADITLKRTNGLISILWNNQTMLTASSNAVIDNIAIYFVKEGYYPGATFGTLSMDYITAIPEPTTMFLLGLGMVFFRKK